MCQPPLPPQASTVEFQQLHYHKYACKRCPMKCSIVTPSAGWVLGLSDKTIWPSGMADGTCGDGVACVGRVVQIRDVSFNRTGYWSLGTWSDAISTRKDLSVMQPAITYSSTPYRYFTHSLQTCVCGGVCVTERYSTTVLVCLVMRLGEKFWSCGLHWRL